MNRGAKTAKAKVGAKPAAATRSRNSGASRVSDLRRRLAEAIEQQAATSEILRVIAESPADVQPVLDAVAERAALLCRAPFARVLLVDGDALRSRAEYLAHGGAPIPVAPIPLKRTTITGRAVLDAAVIHHDDILPLLGTEFPDARENAQLTGFRAVLAVPLMRETGARGAIFLWRREPGLFSPEQVALVQTFARQADIAIENARLFQEVRARNRDLSEALEQQTATGEILRAIASSPTDIQPVLETVVRSAARFCSAPDVALLRLDGSVLRGAAAVGAFADVLRHGVGRIDALEIPATRASVSGRAVVDRRTVHIHDLATESEREYPMGRELQRRFGHRTILATPLLREGTPLGVIALFRMEVNPFSDRQVALLRTFADQAVIAIENVRLFTELETRNRDLTEALEQQTATSEILQVISKSQTDVQPVFETIAAAALRLCRASVANVVTLDGDMLRMRAIANVSLEGSDALHRVFPRPVGRDTAAGRAIVTCGYVAIPDVTMEPGYAIGDSAPVTGFRSVVAVPLVRDGRPIGAISVGRIEPGSFADNQIALLRTFADQAVIAIENVRLFTALGDRNRALTESLEQQTATSEILRVISKSQTDVQPVFDTIATSALTLCGASATTVLTFDGTQIHLAAIANVKPEATDAIRKLFPRPPSHDTAGTRAILKRQVVMIPDVLEDPEYSIGNASHFTGFRGVMAVPLIREGTPIGAIAVGRPEPGPFSDKQIALLLTFADQAVIAIENVRLFKALEDRTAQLSRSVGELEALGEVGQAVSSTLDLETVLRTIVARATELAGMDGGAIYEYDEAHEVFCLHTTDRLPAELVDALRATPFPRGEGAVGHLAVTGEPVEIRDITDAGIYQSRVREILIRHGYRSLLAVPLLREDHLLGGLVVNRRSAGAFSPEVIDLLKTFATQSALAIQNARLFREIEEKSRQLEIASRHKSEFLANMSHELRTPLNAIIGFSEVLAERMFGEINDKQAEYLADILESGRHLLALINDILDLSKIEAGRMELESSDFSLPGAIDNTLTLVRERAQRRNIGLVRTIEPRVGIVHGDERKVKQVLLNLLSNALKFTPEGGRIEVRAVVRDGETEVSVTDTGVGIAPEDQAAVFEEFRQVGSAAKKVEGTGLGLAISRKFIELHGGRIWLTSRPGAGSTFAFTLPTATDARRAAD